MPETECIYEQLKSDQDLSLEIKTYSEYTAYLVWGSLLFVIPILRGFHAIDDEEYNLLK